MGNVEENMREKLNDELKPSKLWVENVSHHHAGHAGSPGTGESHFNVTVVSEAFQGMPKVARFRWVHKLLKAEMEGPVHALSLELKAPGEE